MDSDSFTFWMNAEIC